MRGCGRSGRRASPGLGLPGPVRPWYCRVYGLQLSAGAIAVRALNYWSLARTKWKEEERAASHVERQQILHWLPRMVLYTARGAERRILMFPGYIFFKVQRDWGRVCSTKGISSVVTCEDKPVRIPDCEINHLKGFEDERGLVVLPPMFEDGDSVRIVRGPFAGISGTVRGALERGHLRVLWSMFGKDVSFTVSEGSLESA